MTIKVIPKPIEQYPLTISDCRPGHAYKDAEGTIYFCINMDIVLTSFCSRVIHTPRSKVMFKEIDIEVIEV